MRTLLSTLLRTVAVGLLTPGMVFAADYSQSNNFDAIGDPYYVRNTPTAAHPTSGVPFLAGPDTFSEGRFLRLFEYTRTHLVNVGFDAATTDAVTAATIEFDFRVTCNSVRTSFGCGDGFQMSLLPTADLGETGTIEAVLTERQVLDLSGSGGVIDPSSGAVILTFNTFPNNVNETYNNLEIQTRGSGPPQQFILDPLVFDIATGLSQTPGEFQHARLDIQFTDPRSVTVVLTDSNNDSVTPINLVLDDGAQPYAMRLAFGARNGHATAAIDLDNIVATFTTDVDSDDDADGVLNSDDLCPDTVIPEVGVPSKHLAINRWALFDDDLDFDTTSPPGQGPTRSYSTTDTGGCSCKQIIAAQGLGRGHTMFGCSISAMDDWVLLLVNP